MTMEPESRGAGEPEKNSSEYLVPSGRVARGTAGVPSSKSLAHRALICAALARGSSRIGPLPGGDDVAATVECLRALGAVVREQGAGSGEQKVGSGEQETEGAAIVSGTSGRFTAPREPLNCHASGTTLRLLMGVCGSQAGTFTLDGGEQIRRRPVGDMDAPLAALGARVRYAERQNYPPVVVSGNPWSGAEVDVPGAMSSQFLSGLMIAASLARGPVSLSSEDLVSSPYAEMTAAVMATFGGEVESLGPKRWRVHPAAYRSADFEVEPDASAAAFLWAAAAVTGGEVLVRGTGARSLQGDALFPDLLAQMGCRVENTAEGTVVSGSPSRGLDADCARTPDLVPALAAVAAFAPGPSTFRGVAHLRFKESDRLAVLADALSRLGATVLLETDRMTVVPAQVYGGAELDPQGDHRMAMAFAVMGLRIPGVRIAQPSCVGKSFPNFFTVLESLLA
jgi:3-phosphoshikimate 1-carboxyvinyltransferase